MKLTISPKIIIFAPSSYPPPTHPEITEATEKVTLQGWKILHPLPPSPTSYHSIWWSPYQATHLCLPEIQSQQNHYSPIAYDGVCDRTSSDIFCRGFSKIRTICHKWTCPPAAAWLSTCTGNQTSLTQGNLVCENTSELDSATGKDRGKERGKDRG